MFASIEESQKRLELCKSCENYIPSITMCSICHCIMPLKTKIADLSCPIGKWDRASETESAQEDPNSSCCPPPDTPIKFWSNTDDNVS